MGLGQRELQAYKFLEPCGGAARIASFRAARVDHRLCGQNISIRQVDLVRVDAIRFSIEEHARSRMRFKDGLDDLVQAFARNG